MMVRQGETRAEAELTSWIWTVQAHHVVLGWATLPVLEREGIDLSCDV